MNNNDRKINDEGMLGNSDGNVPKTEAETAEKSPANVNGDYLVRRNKKIDFVARIVCFIGAFIIWFYVMQVDSPEYQEVFSYIPVSLSGSDVIANEYNLSVYNGIENVVEVTVKGRKSEISKIKVEDIVAKADLSEISKPGDYKLDVEVTLPSNLTLEGVYPNVVSVYVDEKVSANLDIIVKANMSSEAPNYTGDPLTEDPEVTVTGPKRIIDELDYAQVKFDVGKISATTNVTQSISLVKKDGSEQRITSNIKLSKTEVSVKIPVYTYKTVPIVAPFKYGYFNESNADITISPDSVRIKGDPYDLKMYDSLQITVLDEKRITSGETQYKHLSVPDNIEIVDGTSLVVIDITLKNTVTREIKYSSGRIRVVNAENIDYTILDDLITLIFRGSETDIEKLKSSDITATLDLSSYADTSGVVTVPVNITLSENTGKSVYELEDYKVQVEIIG